MKLTRRAALTTAVGHSVGRVITLAPIRQNAAVRYRASKLPDEQEIQTAERLKAGTLEATAITRAALDLATALKAAQTLSSEMTVDRLLEAAMVLVIEHVGAQRGVFLGEHGGPWLITARRDTSFGGATSLTPVPLESCDEVLRGIIQYVQCTGEVVCLDDARHDKRFVTDPYILVHQPKSIVCLPIVNQAKRFGILYLENHRTTHAFTELRLALLQVMATQLAVALEHAQVLAALQQEIAERQQTEAANHKLARARAAIPARDLMADPHSEAVPP